MSIQKISFLLRSPAVSHDYKVAYQRDLAEDLLAGVSRLMGMQPVRNSLGSVQHHFYVTTALSAEQNKMAVCRMLDELIPTRELVLQIIVSVTEPDAAEIDRLRQKVSPAENPAFWNAVSNGAAPVQEAPSIPQPPVAVAAPAAQPESPAPAPAPITDEAAKPLPLSAHAAKIQALKDTLLSKVRGQRHAVDSVLQGVFDAEMFAADDPERKGPLATFLFAGPSGVGKTYLAKLVGKHLGRELLVVDMSEYSDNLANTKFNGEHGQPAVVTGFVRQHPDGIILFDEVEKAHINAIHLFLQILDGATMMDHQIRKDVSFRNNIIIMTTNAGHSLYEDSTNCDLSATPRQVILDGLRKDVNPQTQEPYFPECITTRMANGRVILFNHLEPFALLQIVQDEIAMQIALFEKSSGVKVHYDPVTLAALVLYNGGGVADARSLRGLARNIVIRELHDIVMQLSAIDPRRVDSLREITLTIDTQSAADVSALFSNQQRMRSLVLADGIADTLAGLSTDTETDFTVAANADDFKRLARGVVDYILLDPLYGYTAADRIPNDVEDLNSPGMQMFRYVREYLPEVPVYLLDTTGKIRTFDTLLAQGARGIVRVDEQLGKTLKDLSFGALINNATFSLGRSSKFLNFNCAQYLIDDTCAVIAFEKLQIKSAPQAGDSNIIAKQGDNNGLKFADVIGCKMAKQALSDYRDMLENPREAMAKGKKMPKGVLLYGPPGTGKTMLAKAMANECNATFIPTTASNFFAPLVGQTEQNIRDVFKKARKYAPSIIFVDEVDAIARMRTGSVGSTHNEDALTVFLSEMDGFVVDEKRPVFVIAATNYELEGESGRVLDSAFVRRFDQKLLIPLPDTDDRYLLLCKSLERHGVHFGADHEKILRNMAARTAGMNNADLEMVNANYVRTMGSNPPNPAAYMDSLDAYRFGEVKDLDPDHLRQTACHEAGHALVCRLCGVTPSFLTIVSRGNYGGYMESANEQNRGTYTYRELMDRVCRSLAGRAAEIEVYGETAGNNTGASSDIHHARYFIKTALNDYAMGDKLYAEWTQEEMEAQMRAEYYRTCEMIHTHRAVLDALTDRLVQEKSMDQTQLEAFFASMNI